MRITQSIVSLFSAALVSLTVWTSESQAQNRGYTTSAPCPYSCRTQGIPKNHCRDWREGNTCFVEDLSRTPANRPVARPPVIVPARPTAVPYYPPPNIDQSSGVGDCRNLNGQYVARPRVSIGKVKSTGNVFGSKLKVRGSVEGVCLVEAGAFEEGRKREDIRISTTRDFRRFEFEVVVRGDKEPEIRVYNTNGDSDSVEVTDDDRDSSW